MNVRFHGRLDAGFDVIGSRIFITGGCHEGDDHGLMPPNMLRDDVQHSVDGDIGEDEDEERRLYRQSLDGLFPASIPTRVVSIYQFCCFFDIPDEFSSGTVGRCGNLRHTMVQGRAIREILL